MAENEVPVWYRRPSSIGFPISFVIRYSSFGFFHAKPFQRRRPHSTTKQESAARNTVDRCHKGRVQLSVIGALRLGRFAAKRSSPEGSRTSPPLWRAIVSSKARLGFNERNSSSAGSAVQPA